MYNIFKNDARHFGEHLKTRSDQGCLHESPVTSRAKTLVRGVVLTIRRFTILAQVSSSTNLVESIVAREK